MFVYLYICIYVRIPVCSFHHASGFDIPFNMVPGSPSFITLGGMGLYIYICSNVDIVREMSKVCGKSNPTFRSDCSETLHFASILKESESDIEKDIHFAVSLPV